MRYNIRKQKKGQIKIQEMAFMLVAIILFFILVGLFAASIVFKNISRGAEDIKEDQTLAAVTNLAESGELVCTKARANCVDGDKLIALIGQKKYEEFWPFVSLSVLKSTGFAKNESNWVECSKKNYPDCDVFNIYDRNRLLEKDDGKRIDENVLSSFVALCRIEMEANTPYESCEMAMLLAGAPRL